MQSENINIEPSKQKLTLGIDKHVIQKAKAAGINISAITEQVLKAITYQPNNGNTREDVARAYKALFEKAQLLMSKYSALTFQIDVGQGLSNKIQLDSDSGLLIWDAHQGKIIKDNASVDSVLELLYEPMEILQNLIAGLTIGAEENKEKISELKFALRLVKALSDEEGEDKK
jgi:post-segregation antitoxin (ccd killing protein)